MVLTAVSFVPGQRWVSNTESELGLGIVLRASNRRVELNFPASGEHRVYATDNAPLSRVEYQAGERVSTEDGQDLTIEAVMEANGCLIYSALDQAGQAVVLPEQHLNSRVQFSKPQDRLFAGQIDKNRAFRLRCETLEHYRRLQQSPAQGLLGPRVQLLPHQLYIASEVGRRHAPRVLLADEVGLGKTIEAGLILHQQLISGRAQRVLIVVPDSLLHQWLVEMLRRFNLMFTILDEERCQGMQPADTEEPAAQPADGDENPFESSQLVLCTLSFLRDHPQRHAQALAAEWDVLVVDEAHHLRWSEQGASPEYAAIEALARRARGLLLLTATPEQLGVESHFARLRLLDPDRYYDLQTFLAEERKHQPVNQLVQDLTHQPDADSAETETETVRQRLQQADVQQAVREYLGEDRLQSLLSAAAQQPVASTAPATSLPTVRSGGKTLTLNGKAPADQSVQAVETLSDPLADALEDAIRDLLDRHGTGRVLFRNTRASVKGFADRQFHAWPLASSEPIPPAAPDTAVECLLTPERMQTEGWAARDARVAWLQGWLQDHRGEKALVICAHAETAMAVEEHLRLKAGVLSAVFHEGLSLVARDRAAAYFADEEYGAQVLVCSEIGSEGRNFQFAHHLVLFDLPLNPDLLEQRIGRLDRIGQRHTVEIHAPYFQGSAQQVLLRWYHEGLNAFERNCPASQAMFEQFEDELHQCLLKPADEPMLDDLLDRARQRTAQALETLQQGRDRLLELNSFNPKRAEQQLSAVLKEQQRLELATYMEQVFDQFGVDQDHHGSNSLVLRPGDHMLVHGFPALPEDGITATYQRELALSREDMHYLTWEHPMISGAMDLVLSGEFGNTAFCTLKLPPLKAGAILLEAVFTVSAIAPGGLQLQRHLPLTTLRVLVDHQQNDLSAILSAAHLNRLAQKTSLSAARELVRHTRPQITAMIARAEQLAEQQKPDIISKAIADMEATQATELQRLQALAEVNPNIRADEIDHIQRTTTDMRQHLEAAQLRLDALRVAMVAE